MNITEARNRVDETKERNRIRILCRLGKATPPNDDVPYLGEAAPTPIPPVTGDMGRDDMIDGVIGPRCVI